MHGVAANDNGGSEARIEAAVTRLARLIGRQSVRFAAKNPETGRRASRINPPEDWIVREVSELRIVDDELWQATKTRPGDQRCSGAVRVWAVPFSSPTSRLRAMIGTGTV